MVTVESSWAFPYSLVNLYRIDMSGKIVLVSHTNVPMSMETPKMTLQEPKVVNLLSFFFDALFIERNYVCLGDNSSILVLWLCVRQVNLLTQLPFSAKYPNIFLGCVAMNQHLSKLTQCIALQCFAINLKTFNMRITLLYRGTIGH